MEIIILLLLWYLIGIAVILYMISNERDIVVSDIPFILLTGLRGPILLFSLLNSLCEDNQKILIKKRNKR